MCDVKDPMTPPPDERQSSSPHGCEGPNAKYTADDIAFLELRLEEVGLNVEVQVKRRMGVEEERDDASEELMEDIKTLMRAAGEILDRRVRRFHGEEVVERKLRGANNA